MDTPSLPPRRTIVLKASRETLVLVAAATGLTCALAYSVHTRPAASDGATGAPVEGWTGQLADVSIDKAAAVPAEPLTSAALTVPKAAMALPSAPKVAAKPRACDGAACSGKPAFAAPVPSPRLSVIEAAGHRRDRSAAEQTLIARINPLNHIPDAVKRPFVYAGDAVSNWVKRF